MREKSVLSIRSLHILSRLLTITAALILILGFLVLLGSLNATANLSNTLLGLQILGGQAIVNLLTPIIKSALMSIGILVFVIALALRLVLFAAGRFAVFLLGQSVRVEEIEQAVKRLQSKMDQESE